MAAIHGLGVQTRPPDFHTTKSFATVLAGSSMAGASKPSFGKPSTYKGEPAFIISRQELQQMAEPFKNVLVGKFTMGRPSLEMIRKFVLSLGLKGECPVGLLDDKHVLLRPSMEEDFTRLWFRHTWYIQNCPMTVSKWTIDFRPNQESSLAPIWVSFPGLPLPFFDKEMLNKLGGLLGRPLQTDEATAQLKRPSVARIMVELDVAVQPKNKLWIGDESYGFWQKIEYEKWPHYCKFCSKIGHSESLCYVKNPELKPVDNHKSKQVDKGKKIDDGLPLQNTKINPPVSQIYVPKKPSDSLGERPPCSLMQEQFLITYKPLQVAERFDPLMLVETFTDEVYVPKQLEKAAGDGTSVPRDRNGNKSGPISKVNRNGDQACATNQTTIDNCQVDEQIPKVLCVEGVFEDPLIQPTVEEQSGNFRVPSSFDPLMDLDFWQSETQQAGLSKESQQSKDLQRMENDSTLQDSFAPTGSNTLKDGVGTIKAPMDIQPNQEVQRPHFKDVFEEIKWEKLHNKFRYPITYCQQTFNNLPLQGNCLSASQNADDDNTEEDSNRHEDVDDDQFIPVLSKKAKKRNEYSKSGKTMQTRQDFKLKTQAPSRYHKCGAC